MVKRTLKAFSLAEMIMAMVIIMIASVAALPTLTQQKPNIPQVSLRGQYACWKSSDDTIYYQQRCEERACEEIVQPSNSCTFALDSRPAHFFIAAVGKGGGGYEQQVTLVDNPTISQDLKITIDDKTIVTPGDSTTPVMAISAGEIKSNGLYPANIDKCRLLSAGGTCPNDGIGSQEGCKMTQDYIDNEIKVEILGCTNNDTQGNPTNKNMFSIGSFSKNNDGSYSVSNVRVNFKLRDSMHTKSENIGKTTNSKTTFQKILESIPSTRKSVLTDGLLNKRNKYEYKNGAVLILW